MIPRVPSWETQSSRVARAASDLLAAIRLRRTQYGSPTSLMFDPAAPGSLELLDVEFPLPQPYVEFLTYWWSLNFDLMCCPEPLDLCFYPADGEGMKATRPWLPNYPVDWVQIGDCHIGEIYLDESGRVLRCDGADPAAAVPLAEDFVEFLSATAATMRAGAEGDEPRLSQMVWTAPLPWVVHALQSDPSDRDLLWAWHTALDFERWEVVEAIGRCPPLLTVEDVSDRFVDAYLRGCDNMADYALDLGPDADSMGYVLLRSVEGGYTRSHRAADWVRMLLERGAPVDYALDGRTVMDAARGRAWAVPILIEHGVDPSCLTDQGSEGVITWDRN